MTSKQHIFLSSASILIAIACFIMFFVVRYDYKKEVELLKDRELQLKYNMDLMQKSIDYKNIVLNDIRTDVEGFIHNYGFNIPDGSLMYIMNTKFNIQEYMDKDTILNDTAIYRKKRQ